MTSRDPMDALLADLFNGQREDGDIDPIPEHRFEEALSGGPELTQAEKAALWLSPRNRQTFLAVRARLSQGLTQAWHDRAGGLTLRVKAAATDVREPLRLQGDGFLLRLLPRSHAADAWTLVLTLDDGLAPAVPSWAILRLAEPEGFVWLEGKPDATGALVGDWTAAESPIARLTRGLRPAIAIV